MVAIVAGAGLGLERTSGWVLGSRGQLGQAKLGQGGDNVYVNATTGNLVVQNTDQLLIGVGQSDPVARTYNSLGVLGDDWSESVARHVGGLTGALNTAGSTVTLTDWDGSDVTFTWDATRGAYLSTQGAGAYNTLSYSATSSTWTLTDGSTQVQETYDATNGGRITSRKDLDGNTLSFSYNASGLVSQVTTQDGEYTSFIYSGNNLVQVQTWGHPDAAGSQPLAELGAVSYSYDSQNRLSAVTVNLSPQTSGGQAYVTTYGYDGTSNRLTSITQTDGSSLQIAYAQVGGVYRVASLSQMAATGAVRTTTFSYDTTNRVTTVTDPLGAATQLAYDASGQLIQITAPPASNGAAAQITRFSYDGAGDVTSVTAADGATSTYAYDANGNQISATDGAGDVTTRTYSAANLKLTETTYPNGAAAPGETTRYVYDSHDHLRFTMSPLGEVSEYRYNAAGQQTSQLVYAGATYDVSGLAATQSPTEASLASWVSGLTNLATSQRTDTTYDFRGNVASVTTYERLNADGTGDTTGTVSRTTYVYDQAGRLLSALDPNSSTPETFVYDGLGRVIAKTDFAGARTTTVFNDAASTTVVTLADGLTQTSTYDLAGELISYSEAGAGVSTATTTYAYDADGRLARVTDPNGAATSYLYDNLGQKTADVAADGTVTEYAYNADGLLTTTVQHAQKLTASQLAALTDANGHPVNAAIASIRPPADPADQWSWKVYDADQRLIETIDSAGYVTAYQYDGASNLIATKSSATPLDASVLAAFETPAGTGVSTISPGAAQGAAPLAVNVSASTEAGSPVTFDPRATAWDPNGDVLSVSAVGAPAHGTVVISNNGTTLTYTPAAGYTGVDSFTYSLSDGHGGTVTATASVNVTAANEFTTLEPWTIGNYWDGGTGVNFTATDVANYQGQNSALLLQKTLTSAGASVSSGTTWAGAVSLLQANGQEWQINGGDQFNFSIDAQGSGATNYVTLWIWYGDSSNSFLGWSAPVTVPVGRSWATISQTFQAPAGARYAAPIIYPRSTGAQTSAAGTNFGLALANPSWVPLAAGASTTPAPTDTGPVAVSDTLSVATGTPLTFDPRANDTDLEASSLTIASATNGAHGSVAVNSSGTGVTYTPNAGYVGPDSFTYTVSDGHGGTSSATVNVMVGAAPPSAPTVAQLQATGTTISTTAGSAVTFDPRANASDVNNDVLSVSAVGAAAHGTVVINNGGTSVTYTPAAGYVGADSFSYTISDAHGGTVTELATVSTSGPNAYTALTPSLVSNFYTGSDGASYTATQVSNYDGQSSALLIQKTLGAAGATVVNGLTDADPVEIYGPSVNNGYYGAVNGGEHFGISMDVRGLNATNNVTMWVYYWDSNGSALGDSAKITVPVNSNWTTISQTFDAPTNARVAAIFIDQTANGTQTAAGTSFGVALANPKWVQLAPGASMAGVADTPPVAVSDTINVAMGAPLTFDPRANDTDLDADPLTIAAATNGAHGTVAFTGTSLTYTPAAGYVGPDSFTYTVSDGRGGTSTATVDVNVRPSSSAGPTASGVSVTTAASAAITFDPRQNAWDSDGDALTVAAVGAAAHGTVVINSGGTSVTYTPAAGYTGSDSFTYTISDGHGGTVTATANITVTATVGSDRLTRNFYDADGRLVGVLDAAGYLTQTLYDAAGRKTQTIRYAAAAVQSLQASGSFSDLLASVGTSTSDIHTWYLYDGRGLLRAQIDGEGDLTRYAYDAAGYVSQTVVGQKLDVSSLLTTAPTLANLPAAPSGTVLDVTSYVNDAFGKVLTATRSYANGTASPATLKYPNPGSLVTAAGTWTFGSVAVTGGQQILLNGQWASSGGGEELAISTSGQMYTLNSAGQWYVYANGGWSTTSAPTIATISPDGSTLTYGVSGSLGTSAGTWTFSSQTGTGGQVVLLNGQSAGISAEQLTLSGGQVYALNNTNHWYVYANGAWTQTTQPSQGSETTTYTYDDMQRLVQTTTAAGTTDQRISDQVYDSRGRLIQTLSGVGAAALAALGSSPTTAQVAQVYAAYGTAYVYDNDDRLIQKLTPDGKGGSVSTLYYYDALGRLAYEVDPTGAVTQYVVDSFGRVTDTVAVGTRLSASVLSGLTGGAVTSALTSAIVANTALDSHSRTTYDVRGEVASTTDALGATTTYAYDGFGDLVSRTDPLAAGVTTTETYAYDRRGQLVSDTRDAGGLNLTTRHVYDAFGREVQTLDPMGHATSMSYDRAGRVIARTDGAGDTQLFTYDGRGFVLTRTDGANALGVGGFTTTFAYTAFNQQMTMTTAEGVTTTTTYNAYGQTLTVTDAEGRTSRYSYDQNGNLAVATDGAGDSTTDSYDDAGRLATVTDARGVKTTYAYDAAGRTLSRTVDPGGLNLTTSYQYDAKGEQIQVTDPAGTVTQISYDLDGRKVSSVVDPGGQAIATTYAYDQAGRTLTVTEGAGTSAQKVTQYAYDNADRLVSSVVDPSGLNITTRYVYDADGNVAARYDALGSLARFIYDGAGRQIYSIDALGDVVQTFYDTEGHVTGTLAYATRLNLSGLPEVIAQSAVSGLATSPNDEFTGYVYDGDGRMIYSVDASGRATKYQYDSENHVVQTTVYDGLIATQTTPYARAAVDSATQAIASQGVRVSYDVYDAANRHTFSIDAEGGVSRYTYDAAGELVATTRYGQVFTGSTVNEAAMESWASSAAVLQQTRTLYDAAGRAVYAIDGLGYVTQSQYDGDGRLTVQIVYPTAVSVPANATPASLAAQLGSPAGQAATQYKYDTAGRLTDTIDPLGIVTHRVLDAQGNVVQETLAYGTSDAATTVYVRDALGRVTSKTEAYGQPEATTTSYTYDGFGDVRTETDGRNLTTTHAYDALGRLQATWTPSSVANSTDLTGYDYNALGVVDQVVNPNGAWTYNYYDKLNRLVLQVDQQGYATATTYSVGGQVASVTRYAQQASGYGVGILPTLTTSANDETTTFTRDRLDRLTAVTDAQGATESYQLDTLGRRITVTNKLGGVTQNTYDADGRLVSSSVILPTILKYPDPGSLQTADGTWTFSTGTGTGGQLILLNGQLSAVNASGEELAISTSGQIYALNNANQWYVWSNGSWSPSSAPTIAVATATTTYAYDARGNRTQMVEAAGQPEQRTTTYTYDLDNQLTAVSGDAVTAYNQDTLAQIGSVTPTTRYSYDLRGNQIRSVDINNCITDTWYDKLNRKIAQIDPAGTLSTWTYDADGNVTAATVYGDAVAHPAQPGGTPPAPVNASNYRQTTYVYDAANRQAQSRIANVQIGDTQNGYTVTTEDLVTTNVYDHQGDLIQQIDPRGHSVYSFYDKLGRKVAEVDQLNYLTTYQLDAEGNVVQEARYANALTAPVSTASDPTALANSVQTSPDDRITQFTYDRMGRRLTETRLNVLTYSVNATTGALQGDTLQSSTITYAYNALGEVAQETQATGDQTVYSYDDQGRLLSQRDAAFVNYGGQTEQEQISYTYDHLNNVTSMRVGNTDPNSTTAEVTTYAYGPGGRLASMTDADGNMTSYRYDAGGRRIAEVFSRQTSAGNTLVQARTYKYDGDGRIIQQSYASLSPQGVWAFVDQNSQAVIATNTLYDTYGEVIARGENGVWQETYEYDNAGRVWRSNAGDGSSKVYLYNASGDLTFEVASDGTGDLSQYANLQSVVNVLTGNGAHNVGAAAVAGLTLTMYANDARHQQVEERDLFRQLSFDANGNPVTGEIDDQKAYNAFGELWVETKGTGVDLNAATPSTPFEYSTIYTYSTLGKVTEVDRPLIDYTDETGTTDKVAAFQRSPEISFYDISGRLIGQKNSRNDITTWTLLAGRGYQGDQEVKLTQFNQDGGKVTYGVNVFGLTRTITYNTDASPTESFFYDKMNRLVATNHTAGPNPTTSDPTTVYYAYDSQGQRIESWTGALGSSLKDTETTDYDVEGRVISTKALGVDPTAYQDAYTTTSYAWSTAGALSTDGGWIVQTNSANGTITTDEKDYFGRVVQHTQADALAPSSGVTHTYAYDKAGRLVSDVLSTGYTAKTYAYFNTGNVSSISFGDSFGTNNLTTTYGYDKDGNVLAERETGVGQSTGSLVVLEDAHATYDAQDRITTLSITSPGAFWNGSDSRPNGSNDLIATGTATSQNAGAIFNNTVNITYSYTDDGDIRRVQESYVDPSSGNQSSVDQWYGYDSMDRVTTAQGQLINGLVARGSTGVDISYDQLGRRATTTVTQSNGTVHEEFYSYDWRNNVTLVQGQDNGGGRYTLSIDTRDVLDRLTQHLEYDASGYLVQQRNLTYDDASNVTQDTSWTRTSSGSNNFNYQSSSDSYTDPNAGNLYRGVLTHVSSTTGTASYVGGALSGQASATDSYSFDWANGGRQSRIDHQVGSTDNYTIFEYSHAGNLYGASVFDGDSRSLFYAVNADGRILSTLNVPGTGNYTDWDNSYVFDGKVVADIGNTGARPLDYQQAAQQRYTAPNTNQPSANADEFYQSMSPTSGPAEQAGDGTTYTVQAGDTLQSIALAEWGDGSLWYLLADANGLSGQQTLTAGQLLRVPSNVVAVHNNTSTTSVYDSTTALGNVSPTTPPPPKHNSGCGGIGQILVAIVAVAVTLVTAGAAVAALAPAEAEITSLGSALTAIATGTTDLSLPALVGIGVGAGAAGSIASQGLGLLLGVQDKFSWKGLAESAIAAGVTGGVSGIGPIASFVGNNLIVGGTLEGAIDSAGAQGLDVLTGLQSKLDWKTVAVASIAGAVSGAVAPYASDIGSALNLPNNPIANGTIANMAGAVAGAASRSLLTGTDFGDNVLAVLPDVIGSTIGSAVADRLSQGPVIQRAAMPDTTGLTPTPTLTLDGASDGGGIDLSHVSLNLPSVGVSQDVLNGLADTQNTINGLSASTMGNGAGGGSLGTGSSGATPWVLQGGSGDGASWQGQSTPLEEVVVVGRRTGSGVPSQPGLAEQALNVAGMGLLGGAVGFGKAIVNTALGLEHAVLHPIQTAEAIGHEAHVAFDYVTHPSQLVSAAVNYADGVEQAYREGGLPGASYRATQPLGGAAFGVVTAVVGGTAFEGAGAAGAVADAAPLDVEAARRAVATDFYRSGGWSENAIPSHLEGIDFSQPVEVVTVPKGTLVTQYQLAQRQVGNYFTPLGTPADTVGFDTAGRVPGLFELQSDAVVLRSTAKDILDWNGSGAIFKGGGTQYFAPNNTPFVRVPGQ